MARLEVVAEPQDVPQVERAHLGERLAHGRRALGRRTAVLVHDHHAQTRPPALQLKGEREKPPPRMATSVRTEGMEVRLLLKGQSERALGAVAPGPGEAVSVRGHTRGWSASLGP